MASSTTGHDDQPAGPPHPFTVVGIGASAGGLKALQSFFEAVPADSGMVYVVILHLDPVRESQMARLLQSRASIPVTQVTEPLRVEPGHAYIIPPGQDLSMVDGTIQLSPRGESGKHAPIDHFFRTLAQAYGPASVAIVLSGTGSDGTAGLRRVKEAGGITIAQEPGDAEYDSMPRSAISTGLVDMVLPAAGMPTQLLQIQRNEPGLDVPEESGTSSSADQEALLHQVFGQLRARTGHDFSGYKRTTILRRLDRRLRFTGIQTLPDYVRLLRESEDEARALFQDLLISVSSFFRDEPVFAELEAAVIPKLFEGKGAGDAVRVWVAGCATGEEAYSVAILLCEHAATLAVPPRLQIFATDIDKHACSVAREGLYPETVASDVSAPRLERFFDQENGGYRVKKAVREVVLFATHDLLQDPPFSRLDLATCRNVLIYFAAEAQQSALECFHYALLPERFLVLGTAERAEGSELFEAHSARHRIYRGRALAHPVLPRLAGRSLPRNAEAPPREPVRRSNGASYGELHLRMLEAYAPPSLLVDEESRIVHLSAGAGRYLRFQGGEPTQNLLDLTSGDLRVELRAALDRALHQGESTTRTLHTERAGEDRLIELHVAALEEDGSRFALVVFGERSDTETSATLAAFAGVPVEEELRRTRDQLDQLLRTRDVTIEELQSANEELQSINEEHRVATEEMETSREELQSVNEELITVNHEHRATIEELKLTNDDLRNLMQASEIGTLFLDRGLRIRRFTPSLTNLFNLIAADQGRLLAHVTHRLDYDDLAADAEHVANSLAMVEREVRGDDGSWYSVRIHPYRSADDRIDGVVLTFYDITTQKRLEDQLRAAMAAAEEANAVKGVFLATLSHEFRTPLNGMLGYADLLLLHPDVDPEQVQKIDRIKAGVWHLSHMIDEILAFAKLDAGKETVTWERVDAREIAREAAGMLEPVFAAKGLAFAMELPSSGIELETDRQKVRQILVNLLGNAAKYTEQGEIHLGLWEAPGQVAFTVRDTGIGIADEHLERVFDRFWQVKGGLTRTAGGTGLGLAAAREFSRMLGGNVEAESESGRGSSFTLWLPRSAAGAEGSEDGPAPAQAGSVRTEHPGTRGPIAARGATVLIVEDNAQNRVIYRTILEHYGFRVIEAEDGEAGIRTVRDERPDLVLMDISIPLIDGYEATRTLKADPTTSAIPIIALTAHALAEDEARALQAGCDAYISKPAEPRHVAATVQQVLAGRGDPDGG